MQANIRPYELLNTQSGTTVRVKSKSVLEVVKRCYKRGKEAKRLDNPLIPHSDSHRYIFICCNVAEYRRDLGLGSASMEMLIYIYGLYLQANMGVTVYGLTNKFRDSSVHRSEMLNTRKKVKHLLNKGLLVNVGKSGNNADLYIPSERAIEDLKNIFAV